MTHPIHRNLDHQARNIQWLEFELSNNCQYASSHKWCPLSRDTRPLTFLKADIVRKVVLFFKKYDFSGIVYLSGYSEPLIDPRLTDLVKHIKRHLPKCSIWMFSNGVACDRNLTEDIIKAGVDRIMFSVYDKKEHQRLGAIANGLPEATLWPRMSQTDSGHDIDSRLMVYEAGTKGVGGPCYMPTLYYFVRNNGDVTMCFWDWKYTETFGNLYKDTVEETLMNENRLTNNYYLVNNQRSAIEVCNACRLPHDRCTREAIGKMKL